MCGLIGFSGKTNFDKSKIEHLMTLNAFLRGTDSTGIYSPQNKLIKTVDHALKFLITQDFIEDKMFIGHVRAKTVGVTSVANAHPFNEGNVILAHNGTLRNHWALATKHGLNYNAFNVDSHIICGIINKTKNFKVLNEIDGAAALLIHDVSNPEILYAYRNSERPLYKGTIDGNMYISSIGESLILIGCKNVKEFKENTVYTIKNGSIISTYKVVNKPYVPAIVTVDTDYTRNVVKNYYNTFLKASNSVIGTLFTITRGAEYLITGYDIEDNKFKITDDTLREVFVSKWMFEFKDQEILKDDYVKASVALKDNGITTIDKGDYLQVITELEDGYVRCKLLHNHRVFKISKSLLRRLTFVEELDVSNTIINKGVDQNVNKQLSLPLPINNINPLPNDMDDEDDDDYYDMQINQEVLNRDLITISEKAEDMFQFGLTHINDDNKDEFRTLYGNLELTLLNVCEYYNTESVNEQSKPLVI